MLLIEKIKKNFFKGPINSILTILFLSILGKILWPLFNWAIVNGVWRATPDECRMIAGQGACWAFIIDKFRLIIFGLYPSSEQWRPALILLIFMMLFLFTMVKKFWNRKLFIYWGIYLILMFVLLQGGVFGLPYVERDLWGGLPLTLLLSLVGVVFSYPIGIVLALGRRSSMPLIKSFCVGYIELIRGVPLISLLFMASVMFPLFLPSGMSIDKLLRAQIALILFYSAYMAEVVRGGLQAMPKGQFEAAEALGLHFWPTMRLIILPQALKIVIPPTVNTCIGIFKDTSLVVIISLFDLLYTMKLAQKDLSWMGFDYEAYFFVGLIYFIFCYSMSKLGQSLEEELDRNQEKGKSIWSM